MYDLEKATQLFTAEFFSVHLVLVVVCFSGETCSAHMDLKTTQWWQKTDNTKSKKITFIPAIKTKLTLKPCNTAIFVHIQGVMARFYTAIARMSSEDFG